MQRNDRSYKDLKQKQKSAIADKTYKMHLKFYLENQRMPDATEMNDISSMSFIPKTLQKRAAVPKKPCGKKENLLVHGNLMDTGNQNRTDTSW